MKPEEYEAIAQYKNGDISHPTVQDLAIMGFHIAPTPLKVMPFHHTASTPEPLPLDQAGILSGAGRRDRR
jgi:hypothetical protein